MCAQKSPPLQPTRTTSPFALRLLLCAGTGTTSLIRSVAQHSAGFPVAKGPSPQLCRGTLQLTSLSGTPMAICLRDDAVLLALWTFSAENGLDADAVRDREAAVVARARPAE